jgi:hypothetical protein
MRSSARAAAFSTGRTVVSAGTIGDNHAQCMHLAVGPDVVRRQHGVLRTRQALAIWSRATIRAQLAAQRWQQPARGVVIAHNGPITDLQRVWVALLACAPGSALGGLTALTQDGLEGFVLPSKPQVILPEGATRPRYGDVAPHWSTRLDDRDVHPTKTPRRTRSQRSIVDEASWSDSPRRGPCRHRALIVSSILDAVGGIQSLPERDFGDIVSRYHLPPPSRQHPVRGTDGRYFLDVGWDRYDAGCEIHGIPHLEVLQWDADLRRANDIVVRGPRLLVFSSYAIRNEQQDVAQQVMALLRRGGWSG